MHDALCVLFGALKTHKSILGGGNSEIQMALAIEDEAKKMESIDNAVSEGSEGTEAEANIAEPEIAEQAYTAENKEAAEALLIQSLQITDQMKI